MTTVSEFPVWALLPKKETGVSSFLNKYPTYDGRGVILGIFDSGLDPGAPGLQVTTDGKTKVIGRFDCSGSGDVDTSTVVQANNGEIVGLSGRTLKIPAEWKNPSGNYHLGIKNAYELYPKSLRNRYVKERKDKKWDPGYKHSLAEANRQLFEYNKNAESNKGNPSRQDKLLKEDFECKVEYLNLIEKKYSDVGPSYDCIVFNDGECWCACIDTSEVGNLEHSPLFKDFSKSYDYKQLTKDDFLNISVNVYEEGNLLEIVSASSNHGTHVSAIAAANFPDEPEKNGIAPGAQIISFNIGDSRLDTMETGSAIVRAMIKVMESRSTDTPIDVINMSYGEHAHWSTSGRVGELMNEVVDKYGVCWVAAAGNRGPALSTIGTPPDISTDNIIGVGAYVSPDMMAAEYSLRQKAPGLPYNWSSRGPTLDGGQGVLICAPGGALTSVPQYTLRSAELLNGTSMASPHAAGAVAVMLSGLKQKGIAYTPYMVSRALANTAQFMPQNDYFAQGHGLLQVEKAFDHLVNFSKESDWNIRYQVSCAVNGHKGVLMRDGPCPKSKDFTISIEPIFASSDTIEPQEKLNFQKSVAFGCDASWVSYPEHVELTNLTRNIQIRVDPTGLPPGVHSTKLKGYDVKCPEKGPLFHFMVTVVKPIEFGEPCIRPQLKYNALFKPGEVHRQFVLVPEQVSYAVIKMSVLDNVKGGNFVVHALQLKPKRSCKALEFEKPVPMSPSSDSVISFKVKGGIILEVALVKSWMESDPTDLEYTISFLGCRPENETFTMLHGEGVMAFDVLGGIQTEELLPTIQLRQNVQMLKPVESKISPVPGCRDTVPPSRHIYQLIQVYNLHVPKQTDVTPNCSLLSDLLYESEYESQIWMLFDCNKQHLGTGDAYPCKYTIKLDKGDYVIRLQVRHEKREMLEKLSDLPIHVHSKLPNPVSLDVYTSHANALLTGKKATSVGLPFGMRRLPLYISPLHSENRFDGSRGMRQNRRFPNKVVIRRASLVSSYLTNQLFLKGSLKNITVGQYLSGTLTLAKNELGKRVDTYLFKYILGDLSKKNSSTPANKPEKTKWEEYQEAFRDLKTNWLAKMDKSEDADKLYSDLKNDFPSHIAMHTNMISTLEPDSKKPFPGVGETKESIETIKKIMDLASLAIDSVDQNELLAHFGIKADHRVDASTIKTAMERQRSTLVEALCRKGVAASRAFIYQKSESGDTDFNITLEAIDDTWLNVLKFIEANDYKNLGYFGIWHAVAHNNYGRAIKYGLKLYEEKPTKELDTFISWAAKNLGWDFYSDQLQRSTLVRFPSAYRLF